MKKLLVLLCVVAMFIVGGCFNEENKKEDITLTENVFTINGNIYTNNVDFNELIANSTSVKRAVFDSNYELTLEIKGNPTITFTREQLESTNVAFEFINYNSSINKFYYSSGPNSYYIFNYKSVFSAKYLYNNNLTVTSYGSNTTYWKLKITFPNNLTGTMYQNECTGGVATIKNNCLKMPWSGFAKDWYTNAQKEGFSVGTTPKVGAIVVFNSANWNGNSGHVAVVSNVTPLTINEQNVPYGTGKWRLNWVTTSTYNSSIIGYIYYKLYKINP